MEQDKERYELLEISIVCIKDSPFHQAIKILLEDVECEGVILHKERLTGQSLSHEKMGILSALRELLITSPPCDNKNID